MPKTEPSTRPKRARSARSNGRKTRRDDAPASSAQAETPADRRRSMIAEAAYLRAAQRGFHGGDPVADWLESEREVDGLLSRGED